MRDGTLRDRRGEARGPRSVGVRPLPRRRRMHAPERTAQLRRHHRPRGPSLRSHRRTEVRSHRLQSAADARSAGHERAEVRRTRRLDLSPSDSRAMPEPSRGGRPDPHARHLARRHKALRVGALGDLPLPLAPQDPARLHAGGVRRVPSRTFRISSRPTRAGTRRDRGGERPLLFLGPLLSRDPKMQWLMVNADDFGISSKRNAGIVEAHVKGIVTSTSLMPYAAAFREALKYVKP